METNDLNLETPKNEGNLQQEEVDLGTFKSVKNLKDAYDSLRKVFTKNAMELARIKKDKSVKNEEKSDKNIEKTQKNDKKADKNDKKADKNDNLNDFREVILKEDEVSSDKEISPDNSSNNADKVETPAKFWESENWNNQVKAFFDDNFRARNYIKEIGQVLVQDKELENAKFPLQQAWIKVLEQKIDENAINNKDLEQIVMNNEEIKQKIIQQYLNQLKQRKSTPAVINKAVGSQVGAEVTKHAFSMEEAKEMAKKILIN